MSHCRDCVNQFNIGCPSPYQIRIHNGDCPYYASKTPDTEARYGLDRNSRIENLAIDFVQKVSLWCEQQSELVSFSAAMAFGKEAMDLADALENNEAIAVAAGQKELPL